MANSHNITCPNCGSSQSVPLDKVPDEGAWGRCAVCRHRLFIERPDTPSASGSPQLSSDTWTPAAIDSTPTIRPKPEETPEATKLTALFLKTPDGRTSRLTIKEVNARIRDQQILPWDLASEDGGRFTPIQSHPDFAESFYDTAYGTQKTCWNHKEKVGEKICVRCQRCYCLDCAPSPRAGTSTLSCQACGGVIQDTDPGWRLNPYWRRLKEVVQFPKGRYAMAATAVLGLLLWVAGFSIVTMPLSLLVLMFLVYVLASSAKGRETLQSTLQAKPEAGDFREVIERGLLTLAIMLVVAIPFVIVNRFLPLSLASALTFLLGLVAFAYHPMAIAIAVLSEKPFSAFHPPAVIRQMNAMGDDYPALLIGLLIVYMAVFIAQFFIGIIPFVGGLIASLIVAYGGLLAAHVLGWTFYLNLGRLGWLRAS